MLEQHLYMESIHKSKGTSALTCLGLIKSSLYFQYRTKNNQSWHSSLEKLDKISGEYLDNELQEGTILKEIYSPLEDLKPCFMFITDSQSILKVVSNIFEQKTAET